MLVICAYAIFLAPDSDDSIVIIATPISGESVSPNTMSNVTCYKALMFNTSRVFFPPRAYHPSFEDVTVDVADVIATS